MIVQIIKHLLGLDFEVLVILVYLSPEHTY